MKLDPKKTTSVFTLVDYVAATSEEKQRAAIEKDYPMFSHPVDHNEFLNILSGEAAADSSRGNTE